jgi:hypothetical protein
VRLQTDHVSGPDELILLVVAEGDVTAPGKIEQRCEECLSVPIPE